MTKKLYLILWGDRAKNKHISKKQLLFLTALMMISCTQSWNMEQIRSLISSTKQTFLDWQHEKRHRKFFTVIRNTTTDDISRLQKLLAHKALDIHAKDTEERTVLHIAAQYSTPKAVKCLVQHNAQIDVLDANGNTPLHCAMVHWFPPFTAECIIFLTEQGAQVNAQNNEGDTPLHNVCELKAPWNVIECLQERGAMLDARNKLLRTPLHNAVIKGNPLAVAKLIRQGAMLDAQDVEGNTPLHLAFGHHEPFFEFDTDDNRRRIIADLLKAGANIATKNNHELEPCAYMHSFLFEAVYQPLINAIEGNNGATVKELLAQGANININCTQQDELHNTTHLLNIATNCPTTTADMVRLLLDAGADPTIQGHNRHTLLANAFIHGDLEKARLLITHIPRPHIIQKWNNVALPLMLCFNRMPQLPLDVRRLLCLYCVRAACITQQIERCRKSFKTILFAFDGLKRREQYHYEWNHILNNVPAWQQQIDGAIHNRPKAHT